MWTVEEEDSGTEEPQKQKPPNEVTDKCTPPYVPDHGTSKRLKSSPKKHQGKMLAHLNPP